MSQNVLAMILAGGQGTRLMPLTQERTKPAVPFGGRYRIIDFVVNNFTNSGIYKIKILTQFKSDSLNKHMTRVWPVSPILGQYIDLVPAQMRTGIDWYKGTADAIYQNINVIYDESPDYVCVFGGDHVYKMDIRQMIDYHIQKNADITISAIPVPKEEADQFGIIVVNEEGRVIGFQEKPKENAATIPGDPTRVLASMGNYIFTKNVIIDELEKDAQVKDSAHDFGKNILTNIYKDRRIFVYDFNKNVIPGMTQEESGYWRDVGTIDAYWEAHMDLLKPKPPFNLFNSKWPIKTDFYNSPPVKFRWNENERMGMATDSMIAEGCIISGGQLTKCVLSPNVRINSFSYINESILMSGVNVGRHSELKRVIVDKNVIIPPYTKIGFNKDEDLARGFTVTETGITVVPKGAVL